LEWIWIWVWRKFKLTNLDAKSGSMSVARDAGVELGPYHEAMALYLWFLRYPEGENDMMDTVPGVVLLSSWTLQPLARDQLATSRDLDIDVDRMYLLKWAICSGASHVR
jgi:hypothetical protein